MRYFICLFLFLGTLTNSMPSRAAEGEESPKFFSESDLPKEKRLETRYFSVLIPKGWSYQKFEWEQPHATVRFCKKERVECRDADWVVTERKSVSIALAPVKESLASGDESALPFTIAISDSMREKGYSENLNLDLLEEGDSIHVTAEKIEDHLWILFDRMNLHSVLPYNRPLQHITARTQLEHRSIEVQAIGMPAEISKQRDVFQRVLSSIELK